MGIEYFVQNKTVSAVKRVEFVSDRTSYFIQRGRWCNIIVLKVHAPTKVKCIYPRDRFYGKLGQVFYYFPKYHTKILLEHFNTKLGREDIFKLTIGNERLHQGSNYNCVRVRDFAT